MTGASDAVSETVNGLRLVIRDQDCKIKTLESQLAVAISQRDHYRRQSDFLIAAIAEVT